MAGVACGVLSIEEQVLTDFFQAARLRDTTMMARVSSVDFNPVTDGVVEGFTVARREATADPDTERVAIVDARLRRLDAGTTERRTLRASLRRGPDRRWRLVALEAMPASTP